MDVSVSLFLYFSFHIYVLWPMSPVHLFRTSIVVGPCTLDANLLSLGNKTRGAGIRSPLAPSYSDLFLACLFMYSWSAPYIFIIFYVYILLCFIKL